MTVLTDEEIHALTSIQLFERLYHSDPAEYRRANDVKLERAQEQLREIELRESAPAPANAPRPTPISRLDQSDVERAERELTAAQQQYQQRLERDLKTLQRTDGRQLYSPEERAEREQAIRAAAAAELDKVKQRWLERGEEAVLTADRREAIAQGQDPLKRLSTADQARAATRREFVADDCRRATVYLGRRIASVVAERDLAEALLYERYLTERRERGGSRPETDALDGLLAHLRPLTANPADEQERSAIAQLRDTGRKLRMAAWRVNTSEHTASLQAQMLASGRYGAGRL